MSIPTGAEQLNRPPRDFADRPFMDMGYDSLTLMDTLDRIEGEYGIRIAYRYLEAFSTPRDILRFAASHGGQTPARPPQASAAPGPGCSVPR
ncbi:acyl carrier protein [Streptomyces virginiae]|uniref:acyl carrier protein n=1 Tax=Streptomyces virginiae TaxID=1961 RepID=UPI0036CEEF51